MNNFEQLKKQANEETAVYYPFSFPLRYAYTTNLIDFGHGPFDLTRDGLTYLLYRLGDVIDRKRARELWFNGSRQEFVNYINQAREWQLATDVWRADETLWAACVGNKMAGLMTRYNPRSNYEVLEMVEQSGLQDNLTRYNFSVKEMNLYFRYKTRDNVEFGLCARNGETGHVTLGYHYYITSDDYMFSAPTQHKRRHLRQVEKVEADLQQVFESLRDVKVFEFLDNEKAKSYAALLLNDKKFEKLHELADRYDSVFFTLGNFLSALFAKRQEKKFKTITTKAIDLILEKVYENV